ncbi:hypothetical protein L873DRAFT_1828984 [Choiromyces venosus 120613-1]|uniref:histidine kinase n=1 Tax=Choiromyces venosus 120613-1 TaxID=1336337 RepID=A0A3N4JH40_9PEZI|nr:hypothetical protein L873DRAFT_1828984 [Choiromyces venosus 120613-1]
MRIRIREQLSLLVALTAFIAVGVLAVVTWVHNYRLVLEVRSSRFSLTASLKSIQVTQSIALLHNTVYAVSTRAVLQSALRRYRGGNNTVDNWLRTINDLKNSASANMGGFQDVLQVVVYDENLSNGMVGVPDGTVIDGMQLSATNANFTGTLPNGTMIKIGGGLGGRMGLLNATGDNADGVMLPANPANGNITYPMVPANSSAAYYAEADANLTKGLPVMDGFPHGLYPFLKGSHAPALSNVFSPEDIYSRKGLLLGPMRVNESFYLLSFTIPVINTSESTLLGFLTVIMNAGAILDIVQDTRGLGITGQTILVGPATIDNKWTDPALSAVSEMPNATANGKSDSTSTAQMIKRSSLDWDKGSSESTFEWVGRKLGLRKRGLPEKIGNFEFRYLLPPGRHPGLAGQVRKLKDYSMVKKVYQDGIGRSGHDGDNGDGGGSDLDTRNSEDRLVSVGFSIVEVVKNLADWALLVEQDQEEAFKPIYKLRNILLGTVFGTFAVVVALVCPIAHFAVKPIARLKRATEKSTRPPPYTPDSGSSGMIDSFDPEANLENPGIEDRGRNRFYGMGELMRRRHLGRNSSQSGDGSDEQRRWAFRIPGKVRERKHIVDDELTDLTRTFNEMSEELVRQYENLEERVAERTKELEEQKKVAESANQAKSLFVANITHELRTPLNGILGMCAVSMQEDDLPKIKRSLGVVYKSGELLLHLLTDLLTFSRNQVGHMAISLDEKEFRMAEISTQIKAIFETQAIESKIDFSISIAPEKRVREMVFWGDSNRILQVLINLVSNIKSQPFTKRRCSVPEETTIRRGSSRTGSKNDHGSKVSRINSTNSPRNGSPAISSPSLTSQAANPLTAEKISDQILGDSPVLAPPSNAKTYMFEFQVEDTGPGIPEHLHQKVFEPFVQGDLRLRKKYGGTGLGLSICDQLAKLMQGTIELKSLEKAGTTFTLKIPLKYVKEYTPSVGTGGAAISCSNSLAGSVAAAMDKIPPETASAKSVQSGVSFGKSHKPRLVGLSHPFFAPSIPPNPTPDQELTELTATSRMHEHRAEGEEDTGRIRVLVAEDNKVNQEVVLKMLKLEEIYDITIAKDGQEAVDRIKEALDVGKNFHLVLMDIQMPNLDGIESTKIIRHLGYDAPIVALSAFAEESNVKDCLDAGMNYFLAKPIKRPQLKQVLKTYCSTIKEEYASSSTTDQQHPAEGSGGTTPMTTPPVETAERKSIGGSLGGGVERE